VSVNNKKRYFWLLIPFVLVSMFVLYSDWSPWSLRTLKVKDIQLINLPSNRLRFAIKVKTSIDCSAYIEYWKKGTTDTQYTTVSQDKDFHQLYISNTVARTKYRFRVVTKNGNQTVFSQVHPLETQPIYHATPYFALVKSDPSLKSELKGQYFLTQILTEPGSLVIMDNIGEIVWYQPFKKGVKVSHWTNDRTILCIVGPEKIPSSGGDEIIEMNLDGKILTHFKTGHGEMDKLVHHEVRKDQAGNIYALTFTKKIADLSSVKGKKLDTLKGDGIVLFSSKGKKLWEWSVLDHLNPLKDRDILKHKKDWVHGNSVFRMANGDFLMSFRDLNQVWLIDFKTGNVLWKLGQNGSFPLEKNLIFSAQHNAQPVLNNRLMILDNGENTKISRAMIFNLDLLHKTAKAEQIVSLPTEYYTTAKGSAALFGAKKDKVLFCLTDPRVFLITDMKGQILWKINVGGDPYRVEQISDFENIKPKI
jgi:arylsulfate sulfotransferase